MIWRGSDSPRPHLRGLMSKGDKDTSAVIPSKISSKPVSEQRSQCFYTDRVLFFIYICNKSKLQ